MGRLSQIIQVGPDDHKGLYMRQAEGDLTTEKDVNRGKRGCSDMRKGS